MAERVTVRPLQTVDISVRRKRKPRRYPFPLEINILGLYKHLRPDVIHEEGTHIDDNCHMNKNGRIITQGDINKFNGACFIVDYHGSSAELDVIPKGTERVIIRSIPVPTGRRGRLIDPTLNVKGALKLREIGVQTVGITRQGGIGDRTTHLVLHGDGTSENPAILIMEDMNIPPEAQANHVYDLRVEPLVTIAEMDPRHDAIPVHATLDVPVPAQ